MSRTTGAGVAVFLLALLAYLTTLCPTVFVGDSGELATAAATLGIAHPPGYPLWTVLGRVAVVAGLGTPANSLNIMSALASAGAAALVYLILLLLTGRWAVSAGTALAFALSRAVWSQAVVTEVYALNLLVTAGALAAALGARRGRPRLYLLAAYLLGLGAGNHPFVLLAGLPVVLIALVPSEASPESFPARARRLLPMAGLFALGLSVYLYLPVRWSVGPEMNWGGIRSLSEIIDHVLRVQYGGLGEASADTSVALRLRVFGQVLARTAPAVVLIAALGGFVALWRAGHRKRAGLLALFFLLAGPLTAGLVRYEDTFLDHSVVTVFFLPAVMATFLLAGAGIAALDRFLHSQLAAHGRMNVVATVLLAGILPAAMHTQNKKACDRSESTMAQLYAETVLRELPLNARLFVLGDNATFALLYFHTVEGMRPDVLLADRTMNLWVEAYGPDFPERSRVERKQMQISREVEIAFAETERPIFYTELVETADFGNCRLVANGLVYQLLRPGEPEYPMAHDPIVLPPTDLDDFMDSHLAGVTLYREANYLARVGRTDEARHRYLEAARRAPRVAAILRNIGLGHLELGDPDNGDFVAAEERFLAAIELEPNNEDALYNLAILYSVTERGEAALGYFEQLVALGSEYPEVYLNYGIQLVKAGELAEAGRMADQALALAPGLNSATELREAVRQGLEIGGEPGLLEAQARLEPLSLGGTLQLAQRYLERGEYRKATELYREAIQSSPESVEGLYGLGYGLLRVGELGEAADAFRAIRKLDPQNADCRNALAYIFALQADSLTVAEELALEALELNPSLAAYWYDTLGWVRYRAGKLDEALDALGKAEEFMPPDDLSGRAETDYHIGSVLMAKGQREEAGQYLQRSSRRATDEIWLPDLKARIRKLGLEEGTI